ncbi:hypothetical protein BOX15_Mlig000711g1 [Macrostomum lignano]|uniref:LRRNT domain-containing protein n=1 Tax=Macrostomum lignano TaxID=282301 RepID=A0A267EQD0_9PLAT|nr:hypothetical protein BOX15_Mlig000711g1 [Macrostomum lignano]
MAPAIPSSWLIGALLISTATAVAAGRYDSVENCIWETCSVVIVNQASDETGQRTRSLVLHRCDPMSRYPEKCIVPEVVNDPDGVTNFTMRRAGLTDIDVRGFCQFKRLSGLDLSENRIEEFRYPAGMPPGCLSRLRWLSLRGNRLHSVDIAQFTRFPALEKIDLSENGLLEAMYISKLTPYTRLSAIIAQKCRIKRVDISLVRLPSLQDMDLNYNQLSELTNRLNWTWSVREVRSIEEERNRRKTRDPYYYARLSVQMVQNQFGSSAFGRRRLWGLPVPDLLDAADSTSPDDAVVNELKRYRDAFQSFLYLDHVGSTVSCDCRLFHAWNYLRRVYADPLEFSKRNALSIAEWVGLPCETSTGFVGPKTIASLEAEELVCSHLDGCPSKCNCTEQVSPSVLTVDCRGRQLRAMPDRLPESVHPVRYALLLGGNSISELRALPPNQAQLVQRLDLSDNLLSSETEFAPLSAYPQVHSVNLSRNWLLTELPSSLLANATSRFPGASLHLSAGQLVCHCGLLKPDQVAPMRWLLASYRQLRCRVAPDESASAVGWSSRRRLAARGGTVHAEVLYLAEFHHRFCLTVPQQAVQSTANPTVSDQPPPVNSAASSNAVLYIIVVLVAAVLIVLIFVLLCLFKCKRKERSSQPQQQQQQQQQQLCNSAQFAPTYDVANPSMRYVSSCSVGQRIYESSLSPVTKPLLGSVAVDYPMSSPIIGGSGGGPGDNVNNSINDDANSSDFSSGDLSDTESAVAAASAAAQPASNSPYQTVRQMLAVDLPPPLPPRPSPSGVSYQQGQQHRQQRMTRVILGLQGSGTNV